MVEIAAEQAKTTDIMDVLVVSKNRINVPSEIKGVEDEILRLRYKKQRNDRVIGYKIGCMLNEVKDKCAKDSISFDEWMNKNLGLGFTSRTGYDLMARANALNDMIENDPSVKSRIGDYSRKVLLQYKSGSLTGEDGKNNKASQTKPLRERYKALEMEHNKLRSEFNQKIKEARQKNLVQITELEAENKRLKKELKEMMSQKSDPCMNKIDKMDKTDKVISSSTASKGIKDKKDIKCMIDSAKEKKELRFNVEASIRNAGLDPIQYNWLSRFKLIDSEDDEIPLIEEMKKDLISNNFKKEDIEKSILLAVRLKNSIEKKEDEKVEFPKSKANREAEDAIVM